MCRRSEEIKAMDEISAHFEKMGKRVTYSRKDNHLWKIEVGCVFDRSPYMEIGNITVDQLVEVVAALTGFRPSTHPKVVRMPRKFRILK